MLRDLDVYCYKLMLHLKLNIKSLVKPKTYFNIYEFQFSSLWEYSAKLQPDWTSLKLISFETVQLCSFSLASVTSTPVHAYCCCQWVSSIIISELHLEIQQGRTIWLEKSLHSGFKCLRICHISSLWFYMVCFMSEFHVIQQSVFQLNLAHKVTPADTICLISPKWAQGNKFSWKGLINELAHSLRRQ